MAKGYWIARVTVNNAAEYPKYIEAAASAFKRHGARFLVRGGAFEAMEGEARPRNIVIEFPSYEEAVACYRSPDYQIAAAIRQAHADAELIIIEGYDG